MYEVIHGKSAKEKLRNEAHSTEDEGAWEKGSGETQGEPSSTPWWGRGDVMNSWYLLRTRLSLFKQFVGTNHFVRSKQGGKGAAKGRLTSG